MSRTNLKRYLMLLGAIGLVAIAGGSSGTFASFNAEVTNSGNTFTSGTLLLHDTADGTTCTSESASNNQNNGTGNTCDILYTVPLTAVSTTLATGHALTSGATVTTLTVNATSGGAIDAGDQIVVTSGVHQEVFTTTQGTDNLGTTITLDGSQTANYSYPAGSTVTDSQAIHYAKLTLTNAGSLEASDIKFSAPGGCTDSTPATSINTTLSSGLTAGVSITTLHVNAITIPVQSGDIITISDGTNTDTFTAAASAALGATTITVTSHAPVNAFSSGANVLWGVDFGAASLCSGLQFSIIETDSSFNHNSSTNALGCAYGTSDALNTTNGLGCTFGTTPNLGSIPTSPSAASLLSLSANASPNTGTNLSAGDSRYFLIGIKQPDLDNTYQNREAAFSLRWQIDQSGPA